MTKKQIGSTTSHPTQRLPESAGNVKNENTAICSADPFATAAQNVSRRRPTSSSARVCCVEEVEGVM